jgi:hypothetical protein
MLCWLLLYRAHVHSLCRLSLWWSLQQAPPLLNTQQALFAVHPVGTPVVALALAWLIVITKPAIEPVPVAVTVKAAAVVGLQAKVKLLAAAGQGMPL